MFVYETDEICSPKLQEFSSSTGLRWLKLVSTLSRDLVFRKLDTTTFCETSIISEEDAVVFLIGNRKALQKHTTFCFSCLYLQNELGDPNFFLLHKIDQHARIILSAKFKKILQGGFRATLNFQLYRAILNLHRRYFLTLQKASFWHAD